MIADMFLKSTCRYSAIVCASDFEAADYQLLATKRGFSKVIAVDGGYAHLNALGVKPAITIGDFDSLGYVPRKGKIKVFSTEKDKTDYELALEHAYDMGIRHAVVFGALGGRFDHTMGAILSSYGMVKKGMDLILIGSKEVVGFLDGPGELKIPFATQGQVLSVFALSDTAEGVCEEGLKYDLHDAVITNGMALGLSNEGLGQPARISLKKGSLFFVAPR